MGFFYIKNKYGASRYLMKVELNKKNETDKRIEDERAILQQEQEF